jgi:hypothetical protein
MKKLYTIASFLLVSTICFAQQKEVVIIEELNQTIQNQYISPILPPNYNSVVPISSPFWSSDFSNPLDWVLDNSGQQSPLGWTIDNTVDSWYFNNPINSSSGGAFAELTNGDPTASGTGSWPMNVIYTMTTSNPIAVYDSIGSGNATLSFEEYGARFNDLQEVQVSTDGINFTTVEDNLSYAVLSQSGGSSYPNPTLRTVNIGSAIASNPDSVWIRFSWTTNFPSSATNPNVWVAYGWMIDDVQLFETPANSISLIEENFGGWLLSNPTTTADMGIPYTFNPLSQVTANGYECEGAIINSGSMAQNNTKLNVDIIDNNMGTTVFSDNSSPSTLNPLDTSIVSINNFIPSNYGSYNISFWASSDSAFTDTSTRTTIVTDTIYGRDFDWNSDGANVGNGKQGLGRQNCGQVLANAFEFYSADTVTSISFFVHDESVAGASLTVELYEYDPSVSVQTSPPILLEESDSYTLLTSDINSWVTLKLSNPIPVYPSTQTLNVAYLAAVHGQANPTDTSLISASGNEGVVSFIQDNGCNIGSTPSFGTWYGLSNTLMIRMNLGETPIPSSIDENIFSGKLSIFPNPNNGIFTVELNNIKADDYRISVTNVVGQEVYTSTKYVSTLISEKIDLSDLSKGIYMLEVANSLSAITRKIIVE